MVYNTGAGIALISSIDIPEKFQSKELRIITPWFVKNLIITRHHQLKIL